jgi:dihydropteroate synthase
MTPLQTLLNRRRGAVIMGVVNRTPDSFSDGGRLLDDGAALAAVDRMVAEGAELIDVGAESTRPGSAAIPASEQLARLGSIIEKIATRGVLVSVDTTDTAVADAALAQGACVVNSVSLTPSAELGELVARRRASLVLMHCRGSMTDMAGYSVYADDAYVDVVADVAREWLAAADRALRFLDRDDLVLDPGLGYAKNARQSLELCARLDELVRLGFPVLVGPSRKSFVARAAMTDERAPLPPPDQRLGGTIAAAVACAARGASIVRVHDVAEVKQALTVAAAIEGCRARSLARRDAGARSAEGRGRDA